MIPGGEGYEASLAREGPVHMFRRVRCIPKFVMVHRVLNIRAPPPLRLRFNQDHMIPGGGRLRG